MNNMAHDTTTKNPSMHTNKVSIGYAALLNLRADLGLVGDQYSWATSAFYFGYFAWSFPTTWLIVRLPIGKYLSCVVVLWGIILICHAACTNFAGFVAARFFLGVLEASIAPGFSFMTGMFYKREEQTLRHGLWYLGNSAAGLFGGLLAYGIGHIDGALYSWQYMFILFGSVTAAWGLVLVKYLPNGPDKAIFLTPDQRILAVQRTKDTKPTKTNKEFKVYQVWDALTDPQAWLLCANMFGCMLVNSGFSSFQGILIAGFGYSGLKALLYQLPSSATQIGLVAVCSLSGHYIHNCRTILLATLSLISIVGTLLLYLLDDHHRSVKLFGISIMGAFAVIIPISMSMVASNIAGNTKKTTVGTMLFLSYCAGNIISPQLFLASEEPTYPYRNSRVERRVITDDISQSGEPEENTEDKTDRELKGFIYIL
ncbi:hypothetical protein N7454_010538 [Penicillium verhagenii]|nr:hypothetical protein N7454_010538 [Penicillium verhagenii]